MEPTAGFISGFNPCGPVSEEAGLELLQFREEIHGLMSFPPENSSSFTALLELPATQAMDLLHSPDSVRDPMMAKLPAHSLNNLVNNGHRLHFHPFHDNLNFPSGRLTAERDAKLPVFAGGNSTETPSTLPSNTSANLENVKNELITEAEESEPLISAPTVENSNHRSAKRKNREKKGKGLTKKSKNESSEDADELPYVHVRARRGQATDSHSLAERARREKINARMKLLQDLVPGCSKLSGTTLVLDEIINHVQSLQRQVEILSMRLASVNPTIDFNLDAILGVESESIIDGNFSSLPMALMWPDVLMGGNRQHRRQEQSGWERGEESRNFIHHSLLTHGDSHSASWQSNQLEKEL